MYLYIYDSAIAKTSAYQTALAKIEARLVELGINGLIERFTPLKSLEHTMKDGQRKGVKTAIVVGGDKLMSQFLAVMPRFADISVGFIPLEENSRLAQLFGLPLREKACDVLSSRITRTIDVGQANGHFFFCSLDTNDPTATITCDDRYRLSLQSNGENMVSICNLGNIFSASDHGLANVRNPSDGFLEVIIQQSSSKGFSRWFSSRGHTRSIFPMKKCLVRSANRSTSWLADGITILKTPLEVEILPQTLKIIVGKNRLFD